MLSLFSNVCRSLFEKHKLHFAFLVCARIRMNDDSIDAIEWRHLLSGAEPMQVRNAILSSNLSSFTNILAIRCCLETFPDLLKIITWLDLSKGLASSRSSLSFIRSDNHIERKRFIRGSERRNPYTRTYSTSVAKTNFLASCSLIFGFGITVRSEYPCIVDTGKIKILECKTTTVTIRRLSQATTCATK